MNKKEQLKRLICTLYRQDEPEDYTDECMEDMLDNIDFEVLLQAVTHSAKTVYAYLRKIAIDGYVVQLDLPELREMVSLLRRSSNNLNQLARRANETGRIYPEDLADIRQNQAQLWASAKEILRVLSTLD